MTVLIIIAIILIAVLLYTTIEVFNTYTQREANYRFFTQEHTITMVIAYALIGIGYQLSVNKNMDPLNGILLMIIGAILLFFIIRNNIHNTSLKIAIKGSLMQLVLYIPITLAIIPIAMMVFAFLAETRPVYNLNVKD